MTTHITVAARRSGSRRQRRYRAVTDHPVGHPRLPRVSAIVLNHNGGALVADAVASVFASRAVDLHVIVVDNASTDDSLTVLRGRFPRATYIRNPENLGFAAGNNVGIRFALERHADYIVLVNSDALLTPDTLHRLVAAARRQSRPSVLCPVITTPAGHVWYAGARIDWRRMRTVHHHNLPRTHHSVAATQVATGCVMCIDAAVFARIGLLNDSYFLYYEDADFSVCARAADCIVGVVPRASAIHHEVSGRVALRSIKTYWLVLSALVFFHAHAPWWWRIWYLFYVPLRAARARLRTPRTDVAQAVVRAFGDAPRARRAYISHRP